MGHEVKRWDMRLRGENMRSRGKDMNSSSEVRR